MNEILLAMADSLLDEDKQDDLADEFEIFNEEISGQAERLSGMQEQPEVFCCYNEWISSLAVKFGGHDASTWLKILAGHSVDHRYPPGWLQACLSGNHSS